MENDILQASNLKLEFSINYNNKELLELFQKTFGGKITVIESELTDQTQTQTKPQLEENFLYSTFDFRSAKSLIDYLDKYQINSSNFVFYFKWRKVYRIIQRNEHVLERGFIKIAKTQKSLRD
jgi:hypothetical protein